MGTHTRCLLAFAACLLGTVLSAQTVGYAERARLIAQEEARIERFIDEHMGQPLPAGQRPRLVEDDEDGHALSPLERSALDRSFARQYWRSRYFRLHPEASGVYRGARVEACEHGDFEAGLDALIAYEGGIGELGSGECGAIAGNDSIDPYGLTTHPSQFLLTNNVPDPIVGTIQQTNAGSAHAMRINSYFNVDTCRPNWGLNRLSREVVLTEPSENIAFYFALVLQNPTGHLNAQPFFFVRALAEDGTVLDHFCRYADSGSPFFDSAPFSGTVDGCPIAGTIVSSDWTCNLLNVQGEVGDVIRLEFFGADCGAGAHFGYAYVDDICAPCENPVSGLVQLDQMQACVDGPIQVCGTYIPPTLDSVTGVALDFELTILQNGADVTVGTPVLLTHDSVAHTFCFEISPSNFPAGSGGFDLQVEVAFDLGNTESDVNTTSGPNNDVYLGTYCCAVEVPSGLECDAVSGENGGALLMNWDPVPDAVQYQVEIVTYSQSCCAGVVGTPQTHTFTSLPGDPSYILMNAGYYPCASWRVRAQCVAGLWSPWSESQCACTPNACATTVPTAPTCSMGAGANGGTANLNWPDVDGAVQYQVQVTTFSQTCCAGNTGVPQTTTFTTVGAASQYALVNAGYYPCATVRIRTRCYGQYWGPWSTPTCLCTPAYCPASPAPVNPLCDNDNNVVNLSWTAVPYAMYYQVNVRTHTCGGCTPTGTSVNYLYTVSGNSYTLPLPGTSYPCATWTVRAVCASGAVTNWATSQCLCGNTSGCTPLIVNGSFTTSSSAGPLSSCVAGIPQSWKPFVGGFPAASKMYVPIYNGTSLNQLLKFPSTMNPPSWNASPYNTRYVSMYLSNAGVGTVNTTGRAGLWQALSPATVSGGHYFLRVRYASYTVSGSQGSVFNLRATLNNTATCLPTVLPADLMPISQNFTVSGNVGSVVWNTITTPVDPTAALSAITVEARALSLNANTVVLIYLDEVELVRYDCPMDLNGDDAHNVPDFQILTGYSGSSVNSILNLCHAGADANNDGTVNVADIELFNAEFGQPCPNGMVQQPQVKMLPQEADVPGLVALPNPTTGLLTVTHPEVEQGLLEVLAANGDVVFSLPARGTTAQLDLHAHPAGLYLLRLTSASGAQHTLRVVRE